MEILTTSQANLPSLTLTSGQIRSETLSVGQQLLATVVAADKNGQVTLHINNSLINARTALLLTEGQLLNLLVTETGKQTTLKLTDQSLHAALLSQAMRGNLPKQTGMSEILANLNSIAQNPKGAEKAIANLPPAVQQIARQLVQQLPTQKSLTQAQGLKQAMQQSGVLLENKLAQQASGKTPPQANPTNGDLKNNLLALQSTLKQQIRAILTDEKYVSPELAKPTLTLPPKLVEQVQQLNKLDLPALIRSLPKETPPEMVKQLQEFAANLKQVTQLLNIQPGPQPAPQTKTSSDTLLRSVLQVLLPQSKGLLQLLNTPGTPPQLNSVKQGVDGLHSLLSQLFSGTKIGSKQPQPAPPPPLPRSAVAAQPATQPSIVGMQDTQQMLQEMLRQTEGALARMQLQQTSSLVEQETGRLIMNLELPVKRDDQLDIIQLRIHQEEAEHAKPEAEGSITVTLSLDLENTGPVYAKVTVKKETVSVTFWAEEADTLSEARQQIEELEERLSRVGLKPDNLSFLPGQPPRETARQETATPLLDLKV